MNQGKSFSILKFYKLLGLDLGLEELKEAKFTSGENHVKIYFFLAGKNILNPFRDRLNQVLGWQNFSLYGYS